MTEEQQQWSRTMQQAASTTASAGMREPSDPVRGFAFRIISHRAFDLTIMGVVAANIFGTRRRGL